MLCALATLVTVPVLMSSGASSNGEEVAVVAVADTVSAVELEADVDVDDLFDAGADLEAVPEAAPDERDVSTAADAVAAAPQSLVGAVDTESQVETAGATPAEPVTSSTISESPAAPTTAPPTTTPPTTAPPTTQAPTTAAPTTQAPTTAAPVVEETTTTAAPAPEPETAVVEEPQAAAPSTPTPEQWAALRHCESSGNYSVISSNGLYHGAYQFYQPTWDGLANQVGRSDLVGLAPSQAAPADQDALALLLWQQRGNQPWPHCGRHLPSGS